MLRPVTDQLTKPVERNALVSVLHTAVNDYHRYRAVKEQAATTTRTLTMLQEGRFEFRTLEQARDLATLLAGASGIGDRLVVGLSELLINAVEHGNLGIDYATKPRLNTAGTWLEEVGRRLALPEFSGRRG
jgi:YesN/AraC family two-component response regulator